MARLIFSSLAVLMTTAAAVPAAGAIAVDAAADLNNDGSVSIQEARIYLLDQRDSSL
ncbi:MAG: hypothetical protein F6J97_21260 [Leptolyngbya sp. SIO4C1]|nr:hypothetical protein [Leptolyngbya sp. SIO4C1]